MSIVDMLSGPGRGIDSKLVSEKSLGPRVRRSLEQMFERMDGERCVALLNWTASQIERELDEDFTLWPPAKETVKEVRQISLVARSLLRLGASLQKLDSTDASLSLLEEAERILKECASTCKARLSGDEPVSGEVNGALGECLMLLACFDEAEDLLVEEYGALNRSPEASDWRRHVSIRRLSAGGHPPSGGVCNQGCFSSTSRVILLQV